jgi:iron complex transport system substrate-binding protein
MRSIMHRRELLSGLLGATLLACSGDRGPIGEGPRLVSLGGPLTELLFALGVGDQIIGVDRSSYYPDAAGELPQVGYHRRVAAEGVIALAPTLVVHSDAAGPAGALDQIRAAGITMAEFADPSNLDQARDRIRDLAWLVGRESTGDELIAALDREIATLARLQAAIVRKPKVMFIYARGADTIMVAGQGTAPATMIELAGATHAFDHPDFRPISAESVILAAPEVVLVTARGLASVGGEIGLLAQPGIAQTPAGRAERIVALDDLALLGFGPRTGATLLELTRALHPELA